MGKEKNKEKKKSKNLNQILISKKLYVTPEIKNKAKNSNTIFIIASILLVIVTLIYLFNAHIFEWFMNNNINLYSLFIPKEETQIDVEKSVANTYELLDEETMTRYNMVYYDNKKLENLLDDTIITNDDEEKAFSKATVVTDYSGNKLLKNGNIEIPAIKCTYPIIIPPVQNNETIEKCLLYAPTKYTRPDLGQEGNYCIVGHNYRNNLFFSKLKNLEIGDEIIISNVDDELFIFEIYDIYTVEINDTNCLSQATDGNVEVTLITCTDDNKERLIVKAKLI